MTIPQLADPALVLHDPPTPEARPKKDAKAEKWITANGRYALPDPDTGRARTWTRVTTLADTLESRYNLERWGERMTVKGMAMRSDLVAMAASLNPDDEQDKKTLNKVARDAKEAAGSSRGANLGTALHRLTELADAGREVQPGSLAGELNAYRTLMASRGWRVVPAYLERIVCVPVLGCAGRLDKLLELSGDSRLMVGDLKSQKSMDFGGLKIAIQLAIYSHAYAMWDEEAERWEDPPPINQEEAAVLWAPIGQNLCEPYRVDLVRGWHWALESWKTREGRKEKLVTPWPEVMQPPAALEATRITMYGDAGAWALVFKEANSVEELTQVGQDAAADLGGALPAELKELGRELRAKLLGTAAS